MTAAAFLRGWAEHRPGPPPRRFQVTPIYDAVVAGMGVAA